MSSPPRPPRGGKQKSAKDRGAELGALRFKERAAKRKLRARTADLSAENDLINTTNADAAVKQSAPSKPFQKTRHATARITRPTSARAGAVQAVFEVLEQGRSLREVWPALDATLHDPRDRALMRLIVMGVMRERYRLDAELNALLDKPLPTAQRLPQLALSCALLQLRDRIGAPHAVVDETVELMRAFHAPHLVPMANAVLRRYQREGSALNADSLSESVKTNHPRWLLERLKSDWPQAWLDIIRGNNEMSLIWIRVNSQQQRRDDCLAQWQAAGIEARMPHAPEHHPDALLLEPGLDPASLPGFAEGHCSVQDGAAQLAVELLDLQAGQRVLDACAAPGGKAAHMAERCPEAHIVALDHDATRVARMRENFQRLQIPIESHCADLIAWAAQQPKASFERILLDAPCSGTGVIRRHPDIRWLRRGNDLPHLLDTQKRMLDALWPLLAPGGRLVYATCSTLRDENARQIESFLARTDNAVARDLVPAWFGRIDGPGRQNWPGEQQMDGFFYAVLEHRIARA